MENNRHNHIQYNNKNKDISWESGCKTTMDNITPKYKNLKQEVLNNTFAKISKRGWNDTLRKCQSLYKGQIESSMKKQWIQKLREHNIGLKELIALKLYCDFDDLQREFRKCFRCPYNENKERLSSFYHWNNTLNTAFTKFNNIDNNKKYPLLFHGVSTIMNINEFRGQCFGPLSTTTDISVARSFAGKNGMILVIEPIYNNDNNEDIYKPFDISNLSEFPDEHEILLFNQYYNIQNIVLSSGFDEDFIIYDQLYPSPNHEKQTLHHYGEEDDDMEIDEDDMEIIQKNGEMINYLKSLSECNQIIKDRKLITFLYEFIIFYNDNKSKKNVLTQFDKFINSNIKFIMGNHKQMNIECSCDNMEEIEDVFSTYFSTMNIVISR